MARPRFFGAPIPDPALEPFDLGLAVLHLDGQVAGHVATTLGSFATPFSRQMQPWVWDLVIWADGTRKYSEEDYPPWTFVREIRDGYFDGPGSVRYEATWLAEPERTRFWDDLGISLDDF